MVDSSLSAPLFTCIHIHHRRTKTVYFCQYTEHGRKLKHLCGNLSLHGSSLLANNFRASQSAQAKSALQLWYILLETRLQSSAHSPSKEPFKYWDLNCSFQLTDLHDLIQQHSPHLQVIELTDIAGAQDWLLQQKQFEH